MRDSGNLRIWGIGGIAKIFESDGAAGRGHDRYDECSFNLLMKQLHESCSCWCKRTHDKIRLQGCPGLCRKCGESAHEWSVECSIGNATPNQLIYSSPFQLPVWALDRDTKILSRTMEGVASIWLTKFDSRHEIRASWARTSRNIWFRQRGIDTPLLSSFFQNLMSMLRRDRTQNF